MNNQSQPFETSEQLLAQSLARMVRRDLPRLKPQGRDVMTKVRGYPPPLQPDLITKHKPPFMEGIVKTLDSLRE